MTTAVSVWESFSTARRAASRPSLPDVPSHSVCCSHCCSWLTPSNALCFQILLLYLQDLQACSTSKSLLWLLQCTRSQQHICPQHLAKLHGDASRCLQASCSGMGWHFAHQAAALDIHMFQPLPAASCLCLLRRLQAGFRYSRRLIHLHQGSRC